MLPALCRYVLAEAPLHPAEVLGVVSLRDEAAPQDKDAAEERVRAHRVLGREDGVFQDPLENPRDISEVAWIRNYAPTADDVGHVLELVCRYVHRLSDGRVEVGPPLAIRSKHVRRIPDPPPERRMMNLASREFYSPKTRPVGTFRVLTYNVLAEIYTSNQTYPNCPTWAWRGPTASATLSAKWPSTKPIFCAFRRYRRITMMTISSPTFLA